MISAFFDKYDIAAAQDIAVGVSGGADSMALCFALAEELPEINIHALTVDHGLRDDSAGEALHVAEQLSRLSNVTHHILKWDHRGDAPDARIQELARHARYDLMAGYMAEHKISHLFLGHHMDDQAETFLFRLAKGSGVDGLSCMLPVKKHMSGIILCRPMLGIEKSEILGFCKENEIGFINDPSNDCDEYARVRLRKSMGVLAAEGLSAKRLAVCATRHARAREALEFFAYRAFDGCLVNKGAKRTVFNYSELISNPEEIILRVISHAMSQINQGDGYGARTDRVENLCSDLINDKLFRKRTLGGIIFEHNVKNNEFVMSLEKAT